MAFDVSESADFIDYNIVSKEVIGSMKKRGLSLESIARQLGVNEFQINVLLKNECL
jgi:lambda repressor-like predicted transcriptional regulator